MTPFDSFPDVLTSSKGESGTAGRETPVVGVVCALKPEFAALRSILGDQIRDFQLAGRQAARGRVGSSEVWVLRAGWGKAMAASGTQALIDAARPDLILDCGTAGGLGGGVGIGAVVVVSEAVDGQLPVKGADRLIVPEQMVRGFLDALRPGSFSVISGPLLTVERVVDSVEERRVRSAEGFVAVTWETFAVLKTAQVNGVAALSVRVTSDLADGNVKKDFEDAQERVAAILSAAVQKALSVGLDMEILAPCSHAS